MEFPGLVEIVVDALTRRQWIREDDLAHALKLNPKQLRRVLRHLESLRVLTRSHVKERQALKEQRLVERGESFCCSARYSLFVYSYSHSARRVHFQRL
jgi:transcription initiation factor TFIIE subunit alpha